MINDECLIVGGGLKIVDGKQEIFPGCCGLESWIEWLEISPEKYELWLGHDPKPYIEFLPEKQIYRIWADGVGNNEETENIVYIDSSPDELKIALEKVSQDLQNFTVVLKNWAQEIAPNQADKLVETFKTHFHIE